MAGIQTYKVTDEAVRESYKPRRKWNLEHSPAMVILMFVVWVVLLYLVLACY